MSSHMKNCEIVDKKKPQNRKDPFEQDFQESITLKKSPTG
jgi:hypothetical protein